MKPNENNLPYFSYICAIYLVPNILENEPDITSFSDASYAEMVPEVIGTIEPVRNEIAKDVNLVLISRYKHKYVKVVNANHILKVS